MKKISKIAALTLIFALLLTGISGCKETDPLDDLGDAIASVNGQKIYMEDLDRRVAQVAAMYSYDIEGPENEVMVNYLKEQVLESIIDQILIKELAANESIEVSPADIENEMKSIKEQFGDDEKYTAFLNERKLSDEEFQTLVEDQLMLNKIYERATSEITVPSTDPETYYLANLSEFFATEQRQARHILLAFEADALAAIERLDKGEDFAKLATELSMDMTVKDNQGYVGYFTRDEKNLVPEFINAAFEIENVGEYTKKPVQTMYGFHVIKIEDIKPAKQYSFEEVKDLVYDYLLKEEKQTKYMEYIEGLRSEAEITNNLQKILEIEANNPEKGESQDDEKQGDSEQ